MDEKTRDALIEAHMKRQVRIVKRVVVISGVLLVYTVWFMLHQ